MWEDNEICGYGYYCWADGRRYIGHWRANIMDEFGIYTWQDGRMYEGFYKDDKKHGFGVYTWSDGKRYAGWWSHGKQHGLGVFISKEGRKKLGVWEDGKKLCWLTSEEIRLIVSGQLEVSSFYEASKQMEDSSNRVAEFPVQFGPPLSYQIARQRLVNKIHELQIQATDMLEINSLQEIEALREEEETTSFDAEPQPHQKQRGGEKGGRKSA